jgi:protein-tyrosine phosphatase
MTTADPTRINIEFDPLTQRMSGVAVHKNMEFDVPFISHVTGNLWHGGCEAGLVLPEFIENLVSLYPWERYKVKHPMQSETYVRMHDAHGEFDVEQVEAIARWVNVCCERGPTLVHCQAGLNRSSLIAGVALIFGGMSPEVAIKTLREARSPAVLCNSTFEDWLLSYSDQKLGMTPANRLNQG